MVFYSEKRFFPLHARCAPVGGEMCIVRMLQIWVFCCQKDIFPLDCLTRRIFEKLHPDVKWRLCEILSRLWRGLGRVMTRTKHGRHPPEARLLRGVCGVNLCLIGGFVGREMPFAPFSGGRRVGKIDFSFLFQVSIFCYRAGG